MGLTSWAGSFALFRLSLVIVGAWVSPVLYWLGLILLIYSYFRVLSRNRSKRYAENLKYLTLQNKVVDWANRYILRFNQRKQYRYFRCPQCGQQLRVPRGRGKISITCPKCHNQFIKKS